jgi:(p)ppGpp synthase/HD superfamily hydrolase
MVTISYNRKLGKPLMNVIEKALQVASRAHVNQCRKHTDIPYITHPVGDVNESRVW